MSPDNNQNLAESTEIVPITELKETEGLRINSIDPDHVDRLAASIDREGLLHAITLTVSTDGDYAYDIVDGRHRKHALTQLGVEEIAVYDVPGDRYWAVPTEEAEADIGIQSAAANALRDGLTQAEKGRYLKNEIAEKIVDEMDEDDLNRLNGDTDRSPANVRGSSAPPERQIMNHLDHVDEQREAWKFSEELYDELERIRFALDIGDPRTEAEYMQFYSESPADVREAWEREEIGKSAVDHLRQITQDDLRAFALEKASMSGSGAYSVRQLKKVREAASYDVESVNQAIINGKTDNLDSAIKKAKQAGEPDDDLDDDVPEDEFSQFVDEHVSETDKNHVDKVADWRDTSEENILQQCYQMYTNDDDFQKELTAAVDEIEAHETELETRKKERQQAVETFDFDTESMAKGDADHLAPPVEKENLCVFFHDCLQMDDEINDESVQLVFTSPPYFTQRGRIVDEWWPDSEEKTQENADTAYENYLSAMVSVFEKCHDKLAEGGHLMLNISDYMVGGLSKVYDIPSDFSYRLRHAEELNFKYISTITWDKDSETGSRLANFRKSNNIADFKPAWRTERILVFRKGEKREKQDYTVDRAAMKMAHGNVEPFSDIWRAAPTTKSDAAHEAGFPVKLPELAVKLFTYPGDTVIDPFGGFATTLRAVKQVNEGTADVPPRKGLAWENFASETNDQVDYRKQIESQLGGLGSFMS